MRRSLGTWTLATVAHAVVLLERRSVAGESQKRTWLSPDLTDIGTRPMRVVHTHLDSAKLL